MKTGPGSGPPSTTLTHQTQISNRYEYKSVSVRALGSVVFATNRGIHICGATANAADHGLICENVS